MAIHVPDEDFEQKYKEVTVWIIDRILDPVVAIPEALAIYPRNFL